MPISPIVKQQLRRLTLQKVVEGKSLNQISKELRRTGTTITSIVHTPDFQEELKVLLANIRDRFIEEQAKLSLTEKVSKELLGPAIVRHKKLLTDELDEGVGKSMVRMRAIDSVYTTIKEPPKGTDLHLNTATQIVIQDTTLQQAMNIPDTSGI
jgi:hypothetical protein